MLDAPPGQFASTKVRFGCKCPRSSHHLDLQKIRRWQAGPLAAPPDAKMCCISASCRRPQSCSFASLDQKRHRRTHRQLGTGASPRRLEAGDAELCLTGHISVSLGGPSSAGRYPSLLSPSFQKQYRILAALLELTAGARGRGGAEAGRSGGGTPERPRPAAAAPPPAARSSLPPSLALPRCPRACACNIHTQYGCIAWQSMLWPALCGSLVGPPTHATRGRRKEREREKFILNNFVCVCVFVCAGSWGMGHACGLRSACV